MISNVGLSTLDLLNQGGHNGEIARRELLERHRDYLRRMVAARLDRRLAPRVDASDVVQETLADAARRLDDYLRDRPMPFLAWLRQLATERVIDTHRKHVTSAKRSVTRESRDDGSPDQSSLTPARSIQANDTSPSNRMIREERRGLMMAAMSRLSTGDREILMMRHMEQLRTGEIANTLGISVKAAEARLLRALIRLRGRLNVSVAFDA